LENSNYDLYYINAIMLYIEKYNKEAFKMLLNEVTGSNYDVGGSILEAY